MTTVSRYSLYMYVYTLSHGTGWVVMTTVSRYSLYVSLMVQAGLL